MNIPKRIEKLIDRRANLAWQLSKADSELANWIDKNNIAVEECDYRTGCEMYANPDDAAERIREAIINN